MAVFDIKLTDKGRELLAKGELTFQYYGLGDSEIHYGLESKAMGARNTNPHIVSFLQEAISCNKIFPLTGDCSTYRRQYLSEKSEQGIFRYDVVDISEFDAAWFKFSGETPSQYDGDSYFDLSGITPQQYAQLEDGDVLLVKMTNDTVFEGLERTQLPFPYLGYFVKKQGLSSTVELDRNLPYWSQTGNTQYFVLPGNQGWYASATTVDFDNFDNCGVCSGGTAGLPVFKNIYCHPAMGTSGCTAEISGYSSSPYVGLMRYLGYCGECPGILNPGTCGDALLNTYEDRINQISLLSFDYLKEHHFFVSAANAFKVHMPLLMWHRRAFSGSGTGDLLGMTFVSGTELKYTDGGLRYYSLVEDANYIGDLVPIEVGRIYLDLKVVALHYPELVAANSFFANRNWTLPALAGSMIYPLGGVGGGILPKGKTLYMTYVLEAATGATYSWAQQKIAKFVNSTNIDRDIAFTLEGTDMLPYMRKLEATDGLGFYAHRFKLLYQIQDSEKDLPQQYAWKAIDFTTSNITTNALESIDPLKLERQDAGQNQFILTPQRESMMGFEYYGLSGHCVGCANNYIGAENIFLGNAAFTAATAAYKREFRIIVGSNISKTDNPTYENGDFLLSEVGIYDKNLQLVLIAKAVDPIVIPKDGPTELELEYFF